MNEIADDRMTSEEADKLWRQLMPPIRPFLSPNFPAIVCLCGSTRFADAYKNAMRDETLAGRIVLTVGLLGHQEGLDMDGPIKVMLDELHKRKIDLADEVLFLNVGGYIGSSTRSELEYARTRGKVIRFLEPEKAQ